MQCISAAYAVMRSLSVCLSVTFVDFVKTNKHIFNIFLLSGNHTILVFLYESSWQYSDEDPLTEASNAGEVGNSDSRPISGYRIDDCWTCEQQLRNSTVQFIAQTATHQRILFITACRIDDHDKNNRTESEFNCTQRSILNRSNQ